jgi:hypothetical protein
VQGGDDAGHAVPPAEHVLAELHERGDRVLAVADELLKLRRDQGRRFGLVEREAASEPLLGKEADLRGERASSAAAAGWEIRG